VYKTLGFTGWIVVLFLVGLLVWAILQSKKSATSVIGSDTAPVSGD
jgi:hypothetical protein